MFCADFLAAKYALDERSLNPAVRSALIRRLQDLPVLDCLDIGAGTGSTVRRMLAWRASQPWRLTLLERDRDLMERARSGTRQLLTERGYRPAWRGDRLESMDERFAVKFAACELAAFHPHTRYDVIVAHAVMDLVPLAPALARFAHWLQPDGCLYAAINYDGQTELRPTYRDAGFESDLVACYHAAMERREANGESTGGAHCGRRLHALLPRHNFEIVCAGASDWHIQPIGGRYLDQDEACLSVLIGLIAKEAIAADRFGVEAIARWREDRLRRLQARQLELRARNWDVLARYTGGG
jgi:SAM-dependent methyltransferase